MGNNTKKLKELKKEYSDSISNSYTLFNFDISDADGYLCISQRRAGKRKQEILLQYSQVENLVNCMELVKEHSKKSKVIRQKIETLEKKK